jgi:hypothetical protein
MQELQRPPNARRQSRAFRSRFGARSVSAPRALGKPRLVSLPRLLPLGLIKIFALAILACFAAFWVLLHRLSTRNHHQTHAAAPATNTAATTNASGQVWVDVDSIEWLQQPATASTNHAQ